MPNATAITNLQFLKIYNDLVYSLKNFNEWGIRFQNVSQLLQAHESYNTLLTNGERTALTNFLNSINSIIPVNNIPNQIS